MSTSLALRAPMMPVSSRVVAFFAPYDRVNQAPSVFDPAKHGAFDLDSPPSPWIRLGEVADLKRSSQTKLTPLRAGENGAVITQYRSGLDAHVEFSFRTWGKLQMALAAGSQHMNVLAADPNADAVASGGTALAAVAVQAGSTAQNIVLGAGAVSAFSVGDVIAVDSDYQQQVGYVGTGLAAAYVQDPALVLRDPDYVRRVTFNVARVASLTATTLVLAQPLVGGTPATGASAQKVVAFTDREGGSFFQDWSALFISDSASGGRTCYYYPHLQSAEPAGEVSQAISDGFEATMLHASFVALPSTDRNDTETVVCYRTYFPAGSAALY